MSPQIRQSRGRHGYVQARPLMERFWEKVRIDESGCWLWVGAISGTGYGGFSGRDVRYGSAHKFAYEEFVGPVPPGLTIDHLCQVRACVNPAHLEAVTYAENNRRMWAAIKARRTHWNCGHPYTEENTYRWRKGTVCYTCRLTQKRAYNARQRELRRQAA